MLDIRFVVANPAAVKADLKKRQDGEKLLWVDELISSFARWKQQKEDADRLRHSRNIITREINDLRKAGKDIKAKVNEAKELPQKIADAGKKIEVLQQRIDYIMQRLPNVLHESVPVGKDDHDNKELRRVGVPTKHSFPLAAHGELLEKQGLADFDRASKIAGAGFYFLKGDAVLLEQALVRFALDTLIKKGFTPISPPLHLRKEPYQHVIEMDAFENVMYKIDRQESYLIATSEHPIAAMHMNEVLEELPLKYAGISTCFRKEIGSHGVDTRGLFRVHQFTKVEQFVFCKPEDSWKMHEEMLAISEAIVKKLSIPYRVVSVCTGDIGSVAAKKYDIEGWFPRQEAYKELVSCSNCTAYQATGLNIKHRDGKGERQHVHTLNSTALATSRIIASIAENFQRKDGSIAVPKVLQPYMGKDRIAAQ